MSDTDNRGRILFILMTNRPDKLDIDIKRAGRLDRKIPFLYAQTPEDVERVLEAQIRKHKLKTLVPAPRSFFMDVKCPGCFTITTVFSHANTVVVCQGCSQVL